MVNQRYTVGTLEAGAMHQQGYRYVVLAPDRKIVGYYRSEDEAQRAADALDHRREDAV